MKEKVKVKDPKELSPEELEAIRKFVAPVCRYPRDVIHADCSKMPSRNETLGARILYSLSNLIDRIRHLLSSIFTRR